MVKIKREKKCILTRLTFWVKKIFIYEKMNNLSDMCRPFLIARSSFIKDDFLCEKTFKNVQEIRLGITSSSTDQKGKKREFLTLKVNLFF